MAKKVTIKKEFFDVLTDLEILDAQCLVMAIWRWAFDDGEIDISERCIESIMRLGIATGHLTKED